MRTLYEDIRTSQNLFSAWRHVKKSALNSSKPKIRGYASEFEFRHQKHIRKIQEELRAGKFIFDDYEGVLKDKKKREAANKNPRPIAVGTIRNRVVQRAILQVLQPRRIIDPKDSNSKAELISDPRLGKINQVNRSDYGIGGLLHPYGGVEPAIKLASKAMQQGAAFFHQSDIKEFFTEIPTAKVIDIILKQTGDEHLANIFADGLVIHLSNADELKGYAKIFPKNGIGVAQGSSLSAFAGNVLLYDLDHALNNNGVTAIRYIDDILLLSKDKAALDRAIGKAKSRLGTYGFSLYPVVPNSDKAAEGLCSEGIGFLGCMLQPNRCVPSKESCDRLLERVGQIITNSRREMKNDVIGKEILKPKYSQAATLDNIGKRLFGWEKSFAFCTDPQPFIEIDRKVSKKVNDYLGSVARYIKGKELKTQMRILGIPSLEDNFLSDQSKKTINRL